MSTPISKMKINPLDDPHNEDEFFSWNRAILHTIGQFRANEWVFYITNGEAGYDTKKFRHYELAEVSVLPNIRLADSFWGIVELAMIDLFGADKFGSKISNAVMADIYVKVIWYLAHSGAFVPVKPNAFLD